MAPHVRKEIAERLVSFKPALLGLCLVSLSLLPSPSSAEFTSLSFQLEPQREECMYQDVPEGAEVEAMLVVFRGGKLDVKLRVESPAKTVLYEKLLFSNIDDRSGAMLSTIVRKGTSFRADAGGVYAVCVDNRMARWTAKVLTLDIDVRDPNDVIAKAEREAKEARDKAILSGGEVDPKVAFTLMRASANRIHHKMQSIESAQQHHYHREQRHRETIDSTEKRLHLWSLAESLAVVIGAALQVVIVTVYWFRDPNAKVAMGSPAPGAPRGGFLSMLGLSGSPSRGPNKAGRGAPVQMAKMSA